MKMTDIETGQDYAVRSYGSGDLGSPTLVRMRVLQKSVPATKTVYSDRMDFRGHTTSFSGVRMLQLTDAGAVRTRLETADRTIADHFEGTEPETKQVPFEPETVETRQIVGTWSEHCEVAAKQVDRAEALEATLTEVEKLCAEAGVTIHFARSSWSGGPGAGCATISAGQVKKLLGR